MTTCHLTRCAVVHPDTCRIVLDLTPRRQALVVVVPVMARPGTGEPTGGQLFPCVRAQTTQVPVKPVVISPPKGHSAAPGESLAAHHAGGLIGPCPLRAPLVVDGGEGVLAGRAGGLDP